MMFHKCKTPILPRRHAKRTGEHIIIIIDATFGYYARKKLETVGEEENKGFNSTGPYPLFIFMNMNEANFVLEVERSNAPPNICIQLYKKSKSG